ncbi:MAG TPA: deoxynucleoside kinase [Candidatus Polarisedimenticolia bacterium]|jgi:deoxyadenosine/deoxycytidine kinase|nr:deoxynucleoside kinase [Candidatus Polarisedimenticolia bacterium]
MNFKFIAVEGPIGVGKTSLVDLLVERFEAARILEKVENPFLNDFYQDRPGAAFQCQLFFLLNRFRQQQELAQGSLFQKTLICDYIFAKDKIFAYLNLDDSELMLYEKLYGVLEPQVPHPDLVIYLQARDAVLMERIRSRHRNYEREISETYVAELNRAYNYFFFHYNRTPLLVIDTSEIDFVKSREDLEELFRQIDTMQKGVQYYIPLGSAKGPGLARA